MPLPYPAITKIPNTEPAAVPDLWNSTYAEIDANFGDHEFRITAIQSSMVTTLAGLGVTATAAQLNHMTGVTSNVQTQLNGKAATGHNHSLDSLSNVTITSIANGEVLRWTGSAWINNTLAEAGIAAASHGHTLDSLSNVTITANANGEILRWNGSAWINNTLAEAGIAAVGHGHAIADVAGLQAALDGKVGTGETAAAATRLATARSLKIGNSTKTFDGTANVTWTLAEVGAAAASHTHAIANVTGLQAALDAKQGGLGYTPVRQGTGTGQLGNTVHIGWNGDQLIGQVDTTLLGPFAFQGWVSANFADSGHKHSAADITSGTLSSARIPDLAISKIINLQSSLNDKSGMGANTYTGVQTAPGFTVSSSRALKTDIRALDMPGDTIDFFQPVTFRYKAAPEREVAGMIREEVMEIFPLACTDEGIDYGQLVPLLILTIQQDRAKLRELIARVGKLEGEAA